MSEYRNHHRMIKSFSFQVLQLHTITITIFGLNSFFPSYRGKKTVKNILIIIYSVFILKYPTAYSLLEMKEFKMNFFSLLCSIECIQLIECS